MLSLFCFLFVWGGGVALLLGVKGKPIGKQNVLFFFGGESLKERHTQIGAQTLSQIRRRYQSPVSSASLPWLAWGTLTSFTTNPAVF